MKPQQYLCLGFLTTAISLVIVVLAHIVSNRRRIPRGLKLPPGPPGNLLVGNVADLPAFNEWKTYGKWAKEYGDLVYLRVLGTSILFVNSNNMAQELFEKRSKIYSDRPALTMLHELMGFDWGLPVMPYGESFRHHRRVTQRKLTSGSLLEYRPIQLKNARHLLQRLEASPTKFLEHTRHTISAIIMEITYGIQIKPHNDPYVALVEEAMGPAALAAAPGAFMVDIIPALKYIPEQFPGASFQRKARIWSQLLNDMVEVPFEAVKAMMKSGKAQPSMTSTLLEELSSMNNVDEENEEKIIRNVVGMIHAGGADTTICALEIFFLAMVLYPEAQTTAQREIDKVIGPQNLPEFDDRKLLPYTNSLCKEVLRWHSVSPVGIPHRLNQDDIVGDFFIPAGTIVIGNSWFQTTRVCPGRRMAEDSLFIVVASILHIFSISPSGPNMPSLDAFTPGLISHPQNFECNIRVRSAEALELLSSVGSL
ncbi:putative CyP450 monooxygenase [Hysterangium stoloniferum]|nr:putative CyP450 monooxygenase [Hysterangium stoloniferum]